MTASTGELDRVRVRLVRTDALSPAEREAIRALVFAAFGGERDEPFDEHDWEHALGGTHVIAEVGRRPIAHASVVPRELHAGGRPLRTGYVEAVGVHPDVQRRGLGTTLTQAANEHIAAAGYELGALSTGDQPFYERLGWRVWQGPTSVRAPDGDRPTPDEDGGIMVLRVPATPAWLDLGAPISCEWRDGDAW